MNNITIRNMTNKLHKKLQRRAKTFHRSLNSEIIVALEESVFESKSEINEILLKSEEIRNRLNFKISLSEINSAKKTGRV